MIKTERLIIEPLTYKELLRYVFSRKGSVITDEDEAWTKESVLDPMFGAKEKDHIFYTFWKAKNEKGEEVGDIGLKGPPNEFGVVEVGYHVFEQFRNNGYATEMIKGFIEWAKELKIVHFICAAVDFGNSFSEKALLKNGFKMINKTENQYIFILQI